jgi:hypothetical protein
MPLSSRSRLLDLSGDDGLAVPMGMVGSHDLNSSNDMHMLKSSIGISWIVFWVYWLASALGVKEGRGSRRRLPLNGLTALSVVLLLRVFRGGSLSVQSPVLEAIGAIVFTGGIALAIWSRVQLREGSASAGPSYR